MGNVFTIPNVILYLIIMNLIGFAIMFIDKQKAKKRKMENTRKYNFRNNSIRWRNRNYFGYV